MKKNKALTKDSGFRGFDTLTYLNCPNTSIDYVYYDKDSQSFQMYSRKLQPQSLDLEKLNSSTKPYNLTTDSNVLNTKLYLTGENGKTVELSTKNGSEKAVKEMARKLRADGFNDRIDKMIRDHSFSYEGRALESLKLGVRLSGRKLEGMDILDRMEDTGITAYEIYRIWDCKLYWGERNIAKIVDVAYDVLDEEMNKKKEPVAH